MHLSDDEYDKKPPQVALYRLRRSWTINVTIHTIGFFIVLFMIFLIINCGIKFSRINETLYHRSYIDYFNKSIYGDIKWKEEVLRNDYKTLSSCDPILPVNQSPAYVKAGNRVHEIIQKLLKHPKMYFTQKLPFLNDSNEFDEITVSSGSSGDSTQRMQRNNKYSENTCKGLDWVNCNAFQCQVTEEIYKSMPMVTCYYSDIVYINDNYYYIDSPAKREGNATYDFVKSDHVKISCYQFGSDTIGPYDYFKPVKWIGVKTGFRPIYIVIPEGRDEAPSVMILALDSISKIQFKNYFHNAYKVLILELGAIVLQNYNVSESETETEFDLTGKSRFAEKINRNIYLYPDNILFKRLHDYGYYTAYLTDLPMVSSKSYKFRTDYQLTHFFRQNDYLMKEEKSGTSHSDMNCVGDTPKHVFLTNLTHRFTQLPVKRFSFTLISNISQNSRASVEDNLINFFRSLKTEVLESTLFIFMTNQRLSEGEDVNPLVFIVLPEWLKEETPGLGKILMKKTDIPTTPFDIDMTILDAVGLKKLIFNDKGVVDFNLLKGRSLLEADWPQPSLSTLNPIPPTL